MPRLNVNPLVKAVRPIVETLEHRTLLCDAHMLANLPDAPVWSEQIEADAQTALSSSGGTVIVWTNRNQSSDGFNAAFGTKAEQMRGIADAALQAWQQVITNWNRSDSSVSLQVTMGIAGGGFGGAAAPERDPPSDGKPRTGSVSLGGGNGSADPNDSNGWFADPSPFDNGEFIGDEIKNAFVGENGADAGPDFFSLVTIEMAHVLGLISDRNNDGGDWGPYRLENFVTNTGITDPVHNNGKLFAFNGPTIDHLMTGFNGGDGPPNSWGNVVHSANAPADINFAGQNWRGTDDIGNGAADFGTGNTPTDFGFRYLPSFTMAHILKDAYQYSIAEPMSFGTMHAILNETTGRLTIRGQSGATNSADVITVSFINGNTIRVSVNIGNDVPGTGAQPGAASLPAFITDFLAIGVTEIRIDAGDGNDTVNIESLPSFAEATVIGGLGDDVISIAPSFSNLDTVDAPVLVDGGSGADIVLFEDDGSTYAGAYTINTASGFGNPISFVRAGAGTITLTSTTTHTINGAGGANTFNLNATLSGTTWTLNGFNGNDVFNIGAVGGNAESVDGAVTINGMVGTDSFNYNDTTATGTPTYTLANPQLTRTGNGAVTYGTVESIRVDAGAGDNLITYNNTLFTPPPVTLNGNGGNDTIQFDATQQISGAVPQNILDADGGAGADTFVVNDSLSVVGLNFAQITSNNLFIGSAGDADYGAFESVIWNYLTSQNKVFIILSMAASTSLTVNGSAAIDSFLVGGGLGGGVSLDGILGPLTLNGNDGIDIVRFNDLNTAAANTYTLNGSTLTRTGTGPMSFATTENVEVNAGTGADTINVVDHPAGVVVTVDGRAGLDTINVNSDGIGTVSPRFAATQDLASLNLGAGGTAVLTAGGNKVIDTDALSIAATAKLDLGDGALIVDYAGASPLSSIRAALSSGYNGGAWNGNGINSSVAATNTTHALGYAESSAIFSTFPAAFAGRQVDNTAVLARYTRYGDADLNGVVNFDDYARTDAGFVNNRTGWTNGDYDYNGVINFDDYALLDQGFLSQGTGRVHA